MWNSVAGQILTNRSVASERIKPLLLIIWEDQVSRLLGIFTACEFSKSIPKGYSTWKIL
jgi:hypothetical protein